MRTSGRSLAKAANLIGEPRKTSERGEMVVLYENHVVQAKTVIHAATGDYGCLFQCAQPRGRFACVEYFRGMIADGVNKLAGERCDAAEALQKIQSNALGFENRTRIAAKFDDYVARNDGIAIRVNDLDISCRIDPPKNLCGGTGAGNHRWFTRNNPSGCVQRFGDEKLGRDVAVADVFLQGSSDRIVIVRLHGGDGPHNTCEMRARLSCRRPAFATLGNIATSPVGIGVLAASQAHPYKN